MMVVIVVLAVVVLLLMQTLTDANEHQETQRQSLTLATELRQSSDDLTRMVRTYVVTGDGHGNQVSVSVNQVGGANESYGSASGTLGTAISVNTAILGECSG